ncbi:unnamed protein product [Rotaria socialis]|uniref:Uncharacterized protein n=1 Tax=Rotaria socialis TaxID=392032 RepID=A0A820VJL1_9BILA|nr:unnamed protein product [Rotaria socialis]CAF4502688.1 unnamed protein product [Rotaria socialis]
MSEVKQRCQLEGCTRAASTRCYCCNKSVCTRHFTEHIEAVRAQIDPLADEINRTVEKIQGLTIDHLTKTPRAQLDQWKAGMYQLVDDIYFEKSQEMDTLIEQNKEEFVDHKKQHLEMIMKIQDDVKQLVEDGDATFEQVQLVKAQLINVETAMGLFQENFICIDAQISGRDLLKVWSNLNKLQVIRPKSSVKKPASSNVNDHANKKTNERPHAAQAPSSIFSSGFGCSPLGNPKPTLFSPTTSTTTAPSSRFAFGASADGAVTSVPFGSAPTTTPSMFAAPFGSAPTTTPSMFAAPFGSAPTTTPSIFAAPFGSAPTFGAIKSETSGFSFCSKPSVTPTFTVSTFGNQDVTIKAKPRQQKN